MLNRCVETILQQNFGECWLFLLCLSTWPWTLMNWQKFILKLSTFSLFTYYDPECGQSNTSSLAYLVNLKNQLKCFGMFWRL
jgi:hypothetical protein